MGPAANREVGAGTRRAPRAGRLGSGESRRACRVHLKLDTGMGRWGLAELPAPPAEVVGLMSHLATADTDAAYTEWQIERFAERDRAVLAPDPTHRQQRGRAAVSRRRGSTRRAAGSRSTACRRSAPTRRRTASSPCSRWTSHIAQTRLLRAGESTGYGRRFVAEADTWIGIVPVGYADGFRRDLTGTHVARRRRAAAAWSARSRWTRSPSSSTASSRSGEPVELIGRGRLGGGARARRRHDHLRARLRASAALATRDAAGRDRWLTIASRAPPSGSRRARTSARPSSPTACAPSCCPAARSARSTSAPAPARSRSRSRRSCARWWGSIACPSCSSSRASARPG